jgi:signal transduction histidine kinase
LLAFQIRTVIFCITTQHSHLVERERAINTRKLIKTRELTECNNKQFQLAQSAAAEIQMNRAVCNESTMKAAERDSRVECLPKKYLHAARWVGGKRTPAPRVIAKFNTREC